MAVDMDQIVAAHQAIKDARTAARHAWEAHDLELETDQNKLKVFMLQLLNSTNTNSMVCKHGTVYRREVLKAGGADWGAIWEWMKENDAADLVERRLKINFIKDYMEENNGAIPPGINIHREFEVAVRRPSDKASKQGASNDD